MPWKKDCSVYGHTCRRCSKKQHHFEVVCRSWGRPTTKLPTKKGQVCQLESDDSDDELLSLVAGDRKRLFSKLVVDGRTVKFLLDCGSTVNLLPASFGRGLLPPTATCHDYPAHVWRHCPTDNERIHGTSAPPLNKQADAIRLPYRCQTPAGYSRTGGMPGIWLGGAGGEYLHC